MPVNPMDDNVMLLLQIMILQDMIDISPRTAEVIGNLVGGISTEELPQNGRSETAMHS